MLKNPIGWGLVANGANHVIRGLELPVLPPDLWGAERDWRLSYVNEVPLDPSKGCQEN